MEKFYIVPEGSKLYIDFVEFENDMNEKNEAVKKVCNMFGIEATDYLLGKNFKIIPTYNDKLKFKDDFTKKTLENGLRQFKKSSEVSKELFSMFSDDVKQKPFLPLYIRHDGKIRYRLFRQDKSIYCSIEARNISGDEELKEIAPNEFYEVLNK